MSVLFIFTQTNNKLTLTCQENMQTAAQKTKQNRKHLNEQLGQSQATNISRYWNPLFRGDTQFKCFSYVSELFTALSRWFSCDFMCLPHKKFPRRGRAEKRRARPRAVRIKRGRERFPAREGKHFGEVCLWTQLKIIIVKKHGLTVQGLSRLKAPSPLLRRGKSFSCCRFFFFLMCAQQMSPTDDIRALARRLALNRRWALSGRARKSKEMFEYPCDTAFNCFSEPLRGRKTWGKENITPGWCCYNLGYPSLLLKP